MFGANKKITGYRISNGTLVENVQFLGRYEPKKFNSFREQETKENHITFRLFCDTVDIGVKDIVTHESKSFVVGGVYEFSDFFGPHQEILMRQQNTNLHEIITIKTLEDQQSNYDELLGEWNGDKNHTSRELSVLMDSAKLMKSNFIKMLPGGKMENTEWIMTVDFPEKINKEDKIIYQDEEFEIQWIVPFPDKILVGLYKIINNYEEND